MPSHLTPGHHRTTLNGPLINHTQFLKSHHPIQTPSHLRNIINPALKSIPISFPIFQSKRKTRIVAREHQIAPISYLGLLGDWANQRRGFICGLASEAPTRTLQD